jgi:hypothetical protein
LLGPSPILDTIIDQVQNPSIVHDVRLIIVKCYQVYGSEDHIEPEQQQVVFQRVS